MTKEELTDLINRRSQSYRDMDSSALIAKRDETGRELEQERRAVDPVGGGLRHQIAASHVRTYNQELALIEMVLAEKWGRKLESKRARIRFSNLIGQ